LGRKFFVAIFLEFAMDEKLENALAAEAERQGAIDPDVIRIAEFGQIVEEAKAGDPLSVAAAVRKMIEAKPVLFNRVDFGQLSGAAYQSAEERFRAGLRKSRPIGKTDFADLDAGRLSAEEFHALDRCIRGESNSWDRSALVRARARQRHEDALGSDDAA
jgi:hypothetical protein